MNEMTDATTTPQVLPSPVGGPAAWRGPEMLRRQDWKIELDEAQRAELLAALAKVDGPGVDLRDIGRQDFPLPSLESTFARALELLVDDCGFTLLRGVPIEGLTERQSEIMFWGIGQHLGIPIHQKTEADLLTHIRDEGVDLSQPLARGYQSSAELGYHADWSDIVGLLCIRPAKSGGLSTIVSSVSIHDEIVRQRPDLAAVLHEDWWHDRKAGEGKDQFFRCPIFTVQDGQLFSHYGRDHLESAARGTGEPLSAMQIEAMDLIDSLTALDEYVLHMDFVPGDIQLLNNYTIMHSRTAFEDYPEPHRKRDLIRFWLTLRGDFEVPPAFSEAGIVPRTAAFR